MAVRTELCSDPALYIANDTLRAASVEYTVTAYGTDLSPRIIASGRVRQEANSSSLLQRISATDSPEMWVIRYVVDGKEYINHFFTSIPDYSIAKEWIRILEPLLSGEDGFAELGE